MDILKLVPVLAFLVTLLQFLRTIYQARKRISHQIVSSRRILSSKEEEQFNISLVSDGEKVKNVFRVVVEVKNSGRVPIEPGDFHLPLTIKAKEGTEIISAVVDSADPPALKEVVGELQPQQGRVELPKVLLNKGNKIFVKLLVPAFAGLEVVGHAKDTEIRESDTDKTMTRTLFVAGPIMVVSGAIWLALSQPQVVLEAISFPFVSLFLGVLFVFAGFVLRILLGAFKYTNND